MQCHLPTISRFRAIHLLLTLVASISLADRLVLMAQEPSPAQDPLQADQIFDPSHVVEVSVEIKDGDWRKLCGQSRQFLQALGGKSPDKPFTYFRRMSRLTEKESTTDEQKSENSAEEVTSKNESSDVEDTDEGEDNGKKEEENPYETKFKELESENQELKDNKKSAITEERNKRKDAEKELGKLKYREAAYREKLDPSCC